MPVATQGICDIPAEVLGNDLVNVRPLNEEGGFSSLFLAHKQGLDVDVVIKRVKPRFRGRLDEASEARIMTALRHQYLPRIYDLKIAQDGYCYTIIEYIEGCTLREYLRRSGALNQKQALKWTRQLCEAVSYMHSRKPAIIHSDLKPENVMITPQGDVCVIDFNAALQSEDGGDAIGASGGFAAPEQYNFPPENFPPDSPLRRLAQGAQGFGKVTKRTDVYSIGALAYFMLTGYEPAFWLDGVIPLERYDILLGDGFRQVIQRAMSPRPADRFSGAAEMLQALGSLHRLERRYRSWVRQSRLAALLVSVGLCAGVLCMLFGARMLRAEGREQYLLMVQEAQTLRSQQKYDDSRQLLLEAVSMQPERIEAYLELGALLYQQGEYQQAIDLAEGVDFSNDGALGQDAFDSAQGQLEYLLGSCHYQLEEYQEALESYQLAVWFLPEEPAYQRDLAICYARTGNPELAQQTLDTLQGLGYAPGDLALVEGEIRYAYGEYEPALESLSQAAQAAQDPAVMGRAYAQAAQCCQQLGSEWLDEEIELLETACSRLGASANSLQMQMLADAWLRRASVSDADRNSCYNQALGYLEELIQRGYTTFQVRQNAAVVLQYLDRFDEAEAQLLALAEDYPADYRVPMRLALLYADRQGDLPAEQRDYAAMAECWQQAQKLYDAAAVQDPEMVRLQELVQQLQQLGWDL